MQNPITHGLGNNIHPIHGNVKPMHASFKIGVRTVDLRPAHPLQLLISCPANCSVSCAMRAL